MRKTRTFVAVELSAPVRKRASDLIRRLEASGARVSWVIPDNMHITLKFLGEQADDEVAAICRTVMASVKEIAPFEFTCCGAGAFPNNQRPRTLWIGVRQGADAMRQLQRTVDDALAQLGYAQERRAFQPHVTVGRVRSGGSEVATLGQLVDKAGEFLAGAVQADQVVVYGSFLQRGGSRYDVLARARLCG